MTTQLTKTATLNGGNISITALSIDVIDFNLPWTSIEKVSFGRHIIDNRKKGRTFNIVTLL